MIVLAFGMQVTGEVVALNTGAWAYNSYSAAFLRVCEWEAQGQIIRTTLA